MVLLSKIKKMCPTACDPLTVRNVVQFKNQKTYNHPLQNLATTNRYRQNTLNDCNIKYTN